MSWSDLVPSLMFMTIGLVLLYAIWQFAMFLRKRRNREIAAHAFTGDPAVIAETARYLRIVAVSQLVVCAEVVLEGALGGTGATLAPMAASVGITALRIPLAAWAGPRYGAVGLWWVISATATARGLAMMALWRLGAWKRNTV